MDKIPYAEFEAAITRAVNSRSQVYNNSFALSIQWKQDNTCASTDTENFQVILSTLNLDKAEVMVLAEKDPTPGWTLDDKIRSIFQVAARTPGKSIVIIHYAGHGSVRDNRLFATEGPSHRSIDLQRCINEAVAGSFQDYDIGDTDTVFVLDCCYSHVATRASDPRNRSVEILSASDDQTPEALTPPRNTLTGKLRGEIARRKHAGHRFIRLSDVMETIRANSPVVKPTYHVKLGESTCFPFTGVTRIDPNTITPTLRAAFSVHIAENMTREQLERFVHWIETLPPAFRIELDAVYPTNSTLLMLQSSYALFWNLAGYPGVSSAKDVEGPNFRSSLGQGQRQAAPSSTMKENVPFSSRPKP